MYKIVVKYGERLNILQKFFDNLYNFIDNFYKTIVLTPNGLHTYEGLKWPKHKMCNYCFEWYILYIYIYIYIIYIYIIYIYIYIYIHKDLKIKVMMCIFESLNAFANICSLIKNMHFFLFKVKLDPTALWELILSTIQLFSGNERCWFSSVY